MNKKGFLSLSFLAFFLCVDTVLSFLFYQLQTQRKIVERLMLIDQNTERKIQFIHWATCQKQQNSQCEGWIEDIQAKVSWQGNTVIFESELTQFTLELNEQS